MSGALHLDQVCGAAGGPRGREPLLAASRRYSPLLARSATLARSAVPGRFANFPSEQKLAEHFRVCGKGRAALRGCR